jgi:hypothetical protein
LKIGEGVGGPLNDFTGRCLAIVMHQTSGSQTFSAGGTLGIFIFCFRGTPELELKFIVIVHLF